MSTGLLAGPGQSKEVRPEPKKSEFGQASGLHTLNAGGSARKVAWRGEAGKGAVQEVARG